MKVIITGSTGMIGKGILLEGIDNPNVESILLINRNPAGIYHPKIREVILKDFFKTSTIRTELAGFDAVFYSVGVTSVGMKEEDYARVIVDMTIAFAKEVLAINPGITFCFVSGKGTDSSEKGGAMWARVKGKAENLLLSFGFKEIYMFRPGLIIPKRGIRSRTGWYNVLYTLTIPFHFLLRKMKGQVTDTSTMGKAMIQVALYGYPKTILESRDINIAGKS